MDGQPTLAPRSARTPVAVLYTPSAHLSTDELRRLFDRAVETSLFILGERGPALEQRREGFRPGQAVAHAEEKIAVLDERAGFGARPD